VECVRGQGGGAAQHAAAGRHFRTHARSFAQTRAIAGATRVQALKRTEAVRAAAGPFLWGTFVRLSKPGLRAYASKADYPFAHLVSIGLDTLIDMQVFSGTLRTRSGAPPWYPGELEKHLVPANRVLLAF